MKNRLLQIAVTGAFLSALLLAGSQHLQAEEDIYSQDVPPFTTVQCGQCHEAVFNALRDIGGAHRMECRECHETFHNFTRGLSWAERVPACANCHDAPHGDKAPMLDCLSCHVNAHAPIASLPLDRLEPLCARCHEKPAADMAKPSAHSELACSDCHQQKHGYLPKCTECHEQPHNPFVSSQNCMLCHPVHNVSTLSYGEHVPNDGCQGCHSDQVAQLKKGHLAHSLLNCTFCHADEHGMVPTCADCHDTPHSPEMLKGFSGCAACHGNPHDLLPGN
ncbi:MAG: hypothetical protein JXR59_09490 [Desulfuromonadaceae bacterium]|nr:hypothetical protein [Desulfuromonadaceae bacterium]